MTIEYTRQELVDLLSSPDSIEKALDLKRGHIPKKLYKYRSGKFRDVENFDNDMMWADFPENFNDPYDSAFSIQINSDSNVDNDILKHFFINPLRKSLRVCCFSSNISSMLMWAHYSDVHKGFALEYDWTLSERIDNFWPVYYTNELYDLTTQLAKPNDMRGFIALIASIHKSMDWEYESEWRYIHQSSHHMVTTPAPTAIYLGSQIGSCLEQALKEIAFRKKIKVFKMQPHPNKFQLISLPVES